MLLAQHLAILKHCSSIILRTCEMILRNQHKSNTAIMQIYAEGVGGDSEINRSKLGGYFANFRELYVNIHIAITDHHPINPCYRTG